MLNEALAAEILCVLRYRHHEIVAKGIVWFGTADPTTRRMLEKILEEEEEEEHATDLANLLEAMEE